MRRDALKLYLFTLFSMDEFKGINNPIDLATKAASIFAFDLPAAAAEMGKIMSERDGNTIAAAIFGKASDIIGDIEKRGFKKVWADLTNQYNAGVEANARRSK